MLERNLDFGFLSYDPLHPSLQSFEIHRDELVLIVPPTHGLTRRKGVTIRDLAGEQFVAHNVKTPARTRIFELFAQNRTPLNICIELATLDTIKEFVRDGVGLAIMPRLAVQGELERGELVEIPIKGMKIEKPLRLVHRREQNMSHAAKSFLEIVKASMNGKVLNGKENEV